MLQRLLYYREKIFVTSIYFLVFLFTIFPATDKDWGWHYKYGEYFFTHGKILMEDIYSWTLPGFAWVNHSWAYDLLLYLATRSFGFRGLAVLGGVCALLALRIVLSSFRLSYGKLGLLAIFYILLIETAVDGGLRSQVLSLLFFATLVTILIRARANAKILYSLPGLFFLWTNFHGDFTLGLGIAGVFLGSYFIAESWERKNFSRKTFLFYGLILGLSLFATLLSPFGYKGYLESFNHALNPYLKNVLEWDPIYDNCSTCHYHTFQLYTLVLIALFAVAIWKRDPKTLPYMLLFALLVWPSYTTRRLAPVLMLITLPVLASALEKLRADASQYKVTPFATLIAIIIGLQFSFFTRFSNYNLYRFSETDYAAQSSNLSVKLVDYLLENPPSGKGLNMYDWGGYLIGKGVKAKLFVDGRMHVWKKDGYQPFADYIEMYYYKDYERFVRYDFDWVLVPGNSDIAEKIKTSDDLGKWKYGFQDGNSDFFIRVRE